MADEQGKNEATAPAAAEETPATPAPAATPAPSAPAPSTHVARAPHAGRSGGGYRRPGSDRGPRPGGSREGGRKFFRRRKVCKFCVEKIDAINYKDFRLLQQFINERGKITPRRITGVCTPHQHRLAAAIKQARNIALLPFAAR
jgi:small subunit ribosomal protein S18